MTNLDYLTNNIEELAKLLIQDVTEQIYDYDYDENLEYMDDDNYYVCSDEERFGIYEYDNALKHQIEWLMSERKDDND